MTGEAIELFDPFDFIAITDRTLSSDEVFGAWTDCEGRVFEHVEDWTHANSIYVASKGNLLFSIRHLDQIISIRPGSTTLAVRNLSEKPRRTESKHANVSLGGRHGSGDDSDYFTDPDGPFCEVA